MRIRHRLTVAIPVLALLLSLAFLASATNFPDALAGAPLAGAFGAPLYVTPTTCVSSQVQEQVESLEVADAYVLGNYQDALYYDGWEPFRTC